MSRKDSIPRVGPDIGNHGLGGWDMGSVLLAISVHVMEVDGFCASAGTVEPFVGAFFGHAFVGHPEL